MRLGRAQRDRLAVRVDPRQLRAGALVDRQQYTDMLLMWGTPARPASPAGGSIFVTSAPKSRRIFVQCGPASTRVKSITRSPLSGASISVPLEDG